MFNSFSNVLEYGGITDATTMYGHYVEILFDPLFVFFVYSYLSWQERSKTEKARDELKESEEKFRKLFQSANDAIVLWGLNDKGIPVRLIDINNRATEMLGYTREELLTMTPGDFVTPEYKSQITPKAEEIKNKSQATFRMLAERKDGRTLPVEISAHKFYLGDEKVSLSIVRDITERKKAEDELRNSNTLLDNIFSSTNYMLAYLDREFNFINVNKAYADAGRKTRDFFIGKNHFDLYPHEENERIFREVVASGEPFSITEKPFEYPDQPERGTTYWDWSLIPIKDESGAVQNLVFSLNDVTEKVNMSKALRDSEETLRILFKNTAIGILIQPYGHDRKPDGTEKVKFFNPALEKIFGYSSDELKTISVNELSHPEDMEKDIALFMEMLEGKRDTYELEKRFYKKSGELFWGEMSIAAMRNDKGQLEHIIATVHDISERKLAEEKVIKSESFLAESQHIASIGSWEWDIRTNELNWSDETYRLAGREPKSFEPKFEDFQNILHEDDREAVFKLVEETLAGRAEYRIDHRIVLPGGEVQYVFSQGEVERDADGRPVRMVGTMLDITERRKAEKKLKESEARYRAVVDDQTDFISRYHPDGTINFVNTSLCQHAGKEPEELIGRNFLDILSDEDRAEVEQALKTLDSKNPVTSVEHKFVRPETGEVFWQRWLNRAIFDEKGTIVEFQGVGRDITIERRAEDELRRSREFIEKLVNSANVMLIGLDENGRVILSNEMTERITGYSKEELTGKEWFQSMVPKDKYPEVWEVFELIASNKEYPEQFVNPIITKSGEERIISWRNSNLMEGGRLVSTVSFGIDITKQTRIEENLRLQSEILQHIAEGVSLTNISNGTILYTNTAYERMFGYEPGELINKHVSVLNSPFEKDPAEVANEIITSLKEHGTWSGEVHNVRTDGTTFWSYAHITTFDHNEYGNVWVTVQQDITNRKIAERELIANREKLAAMSMELSMTEERERRNIASDLHDHIAQALAMTKVRLGEVGKQAKGDSLAKLESIKTEVDRIINSTRSLIFDLSPPVLYELGFKEAVEWVAEQVQKDHGIQVIVLAGKQHAQIDQEIRVILFKAVRELLMNVIKHAKAATVEVIITDLEKNIDVQVKDDGVGFDVSKIHGFIKKASFGILNLTERIKYIGGAVEFSSEPGQGTAVKITVPLKRESQRL
jgi:PAS domain S-box-containing protein